MALEFIKGEAQRMAQDDLAKHERWTEREKLIKETETRRKEEIILRTIEEHNLRFQPLQGILDYFGSAIEGIRSEYFPESPIFLVDQYGNREARNRYGRRGYEDIEPQDGTPYDYYFRVLSFFDKDNDKFFNVFAIAEMAEGKTSYSILLSYEPPTLRQYHEKDDMEKIRETIRGAKPGELVNLTPPETLFTVSEARRDSEYILTFRTKFIPRNKTILRHSDFNFRQIPFNEISQDTTDNVLRNAAKLLSHKEYEKISPKPQGAESAA